MTPYQSVLVQRLANLITRTILRNVINTGNQLEYSTYADIACFDTILSKRCMQAHKITL